MPRVLFDPATDYYGLLGCRPGASTEELQAAYRRLAKAYHPDLNAGSAVAAARMARVNIAKSVLLDPTTRAAYDQLRALRAGRAGASTAVRPRPVQPTAAAATVAYRVNPTIHPPRAAVRRRRRSGFDGQTAVLLVLLVPLLSALIMYVVEAVQLASKPVQAASTDLSLVPGGRPTARGTAEAAFLMVHTQPPSKALGQKAFNLIQSRGDGTPEGELLRAVGRRLLQTGSAGDVEGWQAAVSELCVLAGHC